MNEKTSNINENDKDSDSKISGTIINDKEKETFKPTHKPKNKSDDKGFKPTHEPKNKSDDKGFKPTHELQNDIGRKNQFKPTHELRIKSNDRIFIPTHKPKNLNNKHNQFKPTHKPKNEKSEEFLNTDREKLEKTMLFEQIKDYIKNINWDKVSSDWTINQHKTNQYSELITIQLDPKQDVSNENPLYRHKNWLEHIYNDIDLNLNDRQIGKICGVNDSIIGRWRKKHDIPTKSWGKGRWIDNRSGRVYVRVPNDYDHLELNNIEKKRNYRLEHIYNMEQHLANHPEWQSSKECLINEKYLKIGCEVHHINQNPADNRIENLWLYKSKIEHAEGELTLYNSLRDLIKNKQIKFEEGVYTLNTNCIQIRSVENSNLKELINYKNLDIVREEIKKINWNEINREWNVKERENQFIERELTVDPTKDCSITNPLYKHKEWVEYIVKELKYNLTDSRLGELCGISRDKARYWRDRVHNITGKIEWGYDRVVDKSDGRIWIKVPSDYENPVVKKDDHQRKFMLEHRYIMERYLAEHPNIDISKEVLIDGKYLKPECEIHHINLDYQDNRIKNLWVCQSSKEHREVTKSLYALVEELLKNAILKFKDGKYKVDIK